VYRMPSLAVPDANAATVGDCARYGAFALFADRAQSVEKRFALTDDNAPYVAEIVRRLDGIPLAIELAAARVKILSPQQLMELLDERFRVLTGGDRSALPRQQTMRALIDWSYDLLSDQEQTLFRRLSIFVGGFTLDIATAVCVDEVIDDLAVLDLLSSLVAKSLVQADTGNSGTCYSLLESTRQYAREKLEHSGEYDAIARAHALAYLDLERKFERLWHSTPAQEWLALVEPNLENWRAALDWALESRGDLRIGQELAALSGITFARLLAEARRWVRAAQETVDADTPPVVAARLDLIQAFIDWRFQQHKSSYAAARRALVRLRELGTEPLRTAQALRIAGNALLLMGRVSEGEPLLLEALTIVRAIGARKFTGWVLESLALARYLSGDLAGGRVLFDETVAIATETDHWQLAATSSLSRAEAEFRGGDTVTALRLAGDALAAYSAGKDRPNVASTESSIAAYLVALGRYDEALSYARDALAPLRESRREVSFAFTLQHLAAIAALRAGDDAQRARDDRERAAGLAGYVDARLAALEAQRDLIDQEEYYTVVSALRDALGESRFAQLMHEGRSWGEDHAVAQAALL
nr:tetratricopeptide repeat protein [Candidatus Eremiobacteraeota bacterium]